MATTRAQAAVARSAVTNPNRDRPRERAASDGGKPRALGTWLEVELRAAAEDGGPLTFEGIASATERAYEMWDMFGPYTEIVSAGAFTDTLNRDDLDVPLVLGHDQMRRIARTTNGTLKLDETDRGLHVLAQLDPNDPDVAYIAPKLRSGLIDEMSFAFRINAGQWSPDFTEYHIASVDLHRGDVAIVGYGANPYTEAALREDAHPLTRGRLEQEFQFGRSLQGVLR